MFYKSSLRRLYLNYFSFIPKEVQQYANYQIEQVLCQLRLFKKADRIASYMATDREVSLDKVNRHILSSGKKLYIPTYLNGEYVFARIWDSKLLDEFYKGKYGIREVSCVKDYVSKGHLDLFLIPGMIFFKGGYRVGMGKGIYDGLLKKIKGYKVGICYAYQYLNYKPFFDSWDVTMDCILSDEFVDFC